LLAGTTGAGPQQDQRLVGLAGSGDVQALAVDLDRPISFYGPVLPAVPSHARITTAVPFALELLSSSTHTPSSLPAVMGPVGPRVTLSVR